MQETQDVPVQSLGRDHLEKENTTYSSRLKNPMDRGDWQATVHGVARIGHDSAMFTCIKSFSNFPVLWNLKSKLLFVAFLTNIFWCLPTPQPHLMLASLMSTKCQPHWPLQLLNHHPLLPPGLCTHHFFYLKCSSVALYKAVSFHPLALRLSSQKGLPQPC